MAAFKAQGRQALEASLSNLEVRFEWFDAFYRRTGYQDISPLGDWWGDVVSLTARLEKGQLAVWDANTLKRYAHRSKIDNTLQLYSVFLPQGFHPDTAYPLAVVLHGSGVKSLRGANMFVVHGAKDMAAPVDAARRVVEKLNALDANVTYIEVPEGGHGDFGDYDLGAAVIAWIRRYSE